MRAIVVEKGKPAELREVDDPVAGPGEVVVDVAWTGVNYKDALALRGDAGVVKVSPLVPGIDAVGVVATSSSPRFATGDEVVMTGAGLGETRHGGFAARVAVDAGVLVARPDAIDARRAAAIGTAGVTAMLSVLRLERDVRPAAGEIVVTGAAGGVGSIAVTLLSRLGYSVTASTGRVDEQGDYLRSLGATTVIHRDELSAAGKPLQRARWAGGIDSVGSTSLATVLAQTSPGGTVTACGLAQGADLPTSVLPFILRGVTLAGVDSVNASADRRREVWRRLATDLDLDLLDAMTTQVELDDVTRVGDDVLAGRVRGRTIVRI